MVYLGKLGGFRMNIRGLLLKLWDGLLDFAGRWSPLILGVLVGGFVGWIMGIILFSII